MAALAERTDALLYAEIAARRAEQNSDRRDVLSLLLQASASDAKFADYKPKVAFFFPGQGAQSVGMAADMAAAVPAAKQLFERASDILGYDLLQVCAEGARLPLLVCAGLCVPLCGDVGVGKREIVVSRALPCLLQHTGR